MLEDDTYVLGAPERILPQTDADESVANRALKLSQQGMRVLAFGRTDELPQGNDIRGYCEPIALVVLSDQVREDIQSTLQAFRDENIQLKVISGDNIETVSAIAAQSGMDVQEPRTGEQLDAMNDAELEAVVLRSNVFARIEPDTKRRVVQALQSQGHYVAMVGDGVNDVPALKRANLAIVMNDGTQISKDVADIVLLNNAMSTLPRAFREGKEITQTIFGTMKMFLVKNMYSVLLFIFIAFMALPFPITPVQISWATFGTVNLPATLIAFGILRPKPMRRFREDVLDFILTGGILGSLMLVIVYVITYFSTERDLATTRSAITVFLTFYGSYIIMSIQGVNFYQPRTFWQNRGIVALMTLLAALTILVMYALYSVPNLFDFVPLTWGQHPETIVTITALLMLSIIILAHGMKYRYLLRRLWSLLTS